jgi:cytolysin-activating lysine-acyltransferase
MLGRRRSPKDAEGANSASTPVAAKALKAEGAEVNLELDSLLTDRSQGTPAATTPSASQPSADELRFAATFGRIVSVLMRSAHYKHYALSDLEWLVVPPMRLGQCAVMEATVNGRQAPVAVALWASASHEVDRRLSENLNIPIKLGPDEWRSGDVLWLIDAVGEANAIPRLLRQVQETVFKERAVRMRTVDANARPIVRLLNSTEATC